MLRPQFKAFLIMAACLASGAKLRQQGLASPFTATQEFNRCLSIVRASSTRSYPGVPARRRSAGTRDH
jgi:hypothetical protein